MHTTEFIHDVESITVRRFGSETDAQGLKMVIKTEGGEKTLHLLSKGPVEIQGDGEESVKAQWQAEALERYSRIITEEWIDKGENYGLRTASGQALLQADELRRQSKEAQ